MGRMRWIRANSLAVNAENRKTAAVMQTMTSGRLSVFLHDDRPSWIPADDEDLVQQVARVMGKNPKAGSLDYVRRHLPHLVDRIEARIERRGDDPEL